jgi:flagellar FliL protein
MLGKKSPATKKPASEAVASSVTHSVDNLVLNPAGTGGARFLMVTATFELKDGGVGQQMKDHDAEVRDRILGVLGRKTIDQLSDVSQREALKKEVLEGVSPLFAKGSILKVFFAQFVIQ